MDVIALPIDLIEPLRQSIAFGPMIKENGIYFQTIENARVAMINGWLEARIKTNEHAPPHFHVIMKGGGEASYTIQDCAFLNGSGEILRYEGNIKHWHQTNKPRLIGEWNRSRPSDCPVGAYSEDL